MASLKLLHRLLFAGCLTFPSLVFAQVRQYIPRQVPDTGPDSLFVYDGSEVPKYFLVRSFFDRLLSRYTMSDNLQAYREVLQAVGIHQGTPAEEALVRAMFEAVRITGEKLDVRPYLGDPVKFAQVQNDLLRKKVHGLRRVYGNLLDTLQTYGIQPSLIETYLDRQIRPEVSIVSLRRPDTVMVGIAAEFEIPEPGKGSIRRNLK